MLELEVGDQVLVTECLVVRGISLQLIIGCDFFIKYGVKHDCGKRIVECYDGGSLIEIPFREETRKIGKIKIIQTNKIEVKDTDDEKEMIIKEITKIMKIAVEEEEETEDRRQWIQKMEELNNMKEELGEELIEGLKKILKKHHRVFSSEPGCIKGYVAQLNMKEGNPFIGKPYPVPYSRRSEVEKEIEKMRKQGIIER